MARTSYSSVVLNQPWNLCKEGLKVYRENGCDFLLAAGGGGTIDTVRTIAVMVTSTGSVEDYQ